MSRKGKGKRKSLSRTELLDLVRLITTIISLIKALVELFS